MADKMRMARIMPSKNINCYGKHAARIVTHANKTNASGVLLLSLTLKNYNKMRLATGYFWLCAGAARQELLATDHARQKKNATKRIQTELPTDLSNQKNV